MLTSPTGAGKTLIAAHIALGARAKSKRLIFEVSSISLIDQTRDAFLREGLSANEIGIVQGKRGDGADALKPIQICSVQTLESRDFIPRADVVIRDEAHKLFKFDIRWMTDPEWRSVPQIGLSATPWSRGLARVYQTLVQTVCAEDLMKRGVLSPGVVFAPTSPDLKDVRSVGGEFVQTDLAEAMNQSKLVADIVQTWLAKAERKPTICFAVDRNHAKALQARFIEAGVRTGYMDCRTPLNERAELYEQFKSRAVEVVCNVDVIGVGIDWPEIEVISYARPTKSEIRFVQNIGRGLRISKGKERLLVLDHSDTHTRLGFAWQIVHDGLHGGRFAVSAPATVQLPRVCPKCKFVKGYSVVECPNCGFRTKPPPPPKEFTGAELAAFQGKAKRGKYDEKGRRQKEFTPAEKAIFYAELKGYAIMKGYKEGWAAHKFKERLEHWPVNKDVAPIMNMSPATGQWLRSRWIAESRSRANQAAESEVMRAIRAPVAPRNNAERNGLVPGTLCSEEDLEDFK